MNKIVAIDGPAGSGKGTIASVIADRCHLVNIDTGATYRCLALATLKNNIEITNQKEIIKLCSKIKIDIDAENKVYLNGEEVTEAIRSEDVTKIVSNISSIPEVRNIMVALQRKMAEGKDVIMEGRDITTVVFPNAQYKFYLDADLNERAKRRYKQNQEKGITMSFEDISDNIKKRDYNDMHKKVGALIKAEDAIYIDTTNMTIEQVVLKIIKIIEGD